MQSGSFFTKIPFFTNIFDIICITVTIILSMVYKKGCYYSTLRENHKTRQNMQNSYILKRFLFEILNRFIALGYIAFALVNCIFSYFILKKNIFFK